MSNIVRTLGFFAVALTTTSCLPPCRWDYEAARCAIDSIEIRNTSESAALRDVVEVEARYVVTAPRGRTLVHASVWHRLRAGETRDAANAAIEAYFKRYADMPCRWGHITSGTCATNDVRFAMPGCRDQRTQTCYDLAETELR